MAEELEKQANAAFVDEDLESAVDLYTKAISLNPANPVLFVSRAQAHIKLQNFTDAVADANRAIELNSSLPKAYLRKGIACFSLEEYQTAKAAFLAGAELEPNNSSFRKWLNDCDTKLAEEAAANGDHLVVEPPASVHGTVSSSSNSKETLAIDDQAGDATAPVSSVSASTLAGSEVHTSAPATSSPLPAAPSPKFRHDFYENPTEVVVTIFARGVKKEDVKIDFGEQFLSVVIQTPNEDPYVFQQRLFAKILVSQCKYSVLSTKIEIRLAKAEHIQWKSLVYDKEHKMLPSHNVSRVIPEAKTVYPSSSKKGHRDWDKLAAEVKKEEKDEKLEGDAALNKLFRDIYQGADEDTRRAMQKSFVESNGTVLSTNWKEVGSKQVEGSPPQGMEMKKWEV